MEASRFTTAPHGIVRSLAVLLGGIAAVVLGLVILTALARPAGAASLPLGSSPVSAPPVAVPGVSVPTLSVTRMQPAPTIASVTPVVRTKVTDVSRSAANSQANGPAVSNTAGSLAAQMLAAGRAAAAPIGVGLGALVNPLLGSVPISVSRGSGATPIAVGAFQSLGIGSAAIANATINGLPTTAPRLAWANRPASPAPLAPNRAPTTPYPSPNSPLTANDLSGDSATGLGGSLLGSLPPSNLLLPVLALAGVLLARGTRPQLLLDSRCSPPG
jgi:hypothetical protein